MFSGSTSKALDFIDENILMWREYVLKGLREEVKKSQKLADAKFVQESILTPTIDWAEIARSCI